MARNTLWTLLLLFALKRISSESVDTCPDICACSNTTASVNCTGRLKNATYTLPNTTTDLYVDSNDMTRVPSELLSTAPHLRLLSIRFNKLQRIDANDGLCGGGGTLQHLYADANAIGYIDAEAFKDCRELSTLSLTNNLLTIDLIATLLPFLPALGTLDCGSNQFGNLIALPEQFRGVSKLFKLSLDYMAIQRIPGDFLANLTSRGSIKQLDLSGNALLQVSAEAFGNLTSLRDINLSDTLLSLQNMIAIFDVIQQYESLHRIDVRGVFVTDTTGGEDDSLLRSFANSSIRVLHLEKNYGLFQGMLHRHFLSPVSEHLHKLYLDDNELHTIHHKAFSNMYKLTELSLRGNFLACVTECGYVQMSPPLPALETLDASDNSISDAAAYLSFNKQTFPRLKHLNLKNNRIYHIADDTFFSINSLRSLDMSRNPIQFISKDSLVHQRELMSLSIAECYNLKELPKYVFSSQNKLQKLNLRGNNLRKAPPEAWIGLNNLQSLDLGHNDFRDDINLTLTSGALETVDLSHNNIEDLTTTIRVNATSVTKMVLSYNRIRRIDPEYFLEFNRLKHLDLSYNSLVTIDVSVLTALPSDFKQLSVAGNPFYCNCATLPFINWIKQNNEMLVHLRGTKCVSGSPWITEQVTAVDTTSITCKIDAANNKSTTLLVALVVIVSALILASVILTAYGLSHRWSCKHKRSKKWKSIPPREVAVAITSTAVENQEENDAKLKTSREETAATSLLKCIPMKLFSSKKNCTNSNMESPLMENMNEVEANI